MPNSGYIGLWAAMLGALMLASALAAPSGQAQGRAAASNELKGKGWVVRVEPTGGVEIDVGGERYALATHLSHPGDAIGWNDLGVPGTSQESKWKPRIRRGADGSLTVSVAGARYALERKIQVARHRIIITDAVANTGDEGVGIIYRHDLTAPQPFRQHLIGGANEAAYRRLAENPSAYVAQTKTSLGWLAEDSLLRLQLSMTSSADGIHMSAERFALPPGRSHTFRWALYPLAAGADYWTFVNQVRRDWDVNFKLIGPWILLDVTRRMDLIRDPAALRHYLTRNKAQVVALTPWVDYENYSSALGRPINRAELKPLLREAMAAIKRVDPGIVCIGCIEGNLVSLPEEAQKAIYATVSGAPQNQYQFTPEQMEILKRQNIRWKDCLLADRQGRYRYELYYRGNHYPMIAIAVYAAPGNDQHKYWLDQAKYLLEDVGLDGIYIDQFNLAFNDAQRYSYDKWDGTTVDIDPVTGRITSRYTDGALVGIDAQRSLIEYVLSKGRYMVANTYPASAETQALRAHRFNEGEWAFDVFSWADGAEPPLEPYGTAGHFSTPISLGFRPERYGQKGLDNYARVIMKGAIAYLRHGLLYYHYGTEIPETAPIPQAGPGAGEYGALNHMFPITPVELHEGYIVGKERIVTCVSGSYRWSSKRKPEVLVFDLTGRPVAPDAKVSMQGTRRQVRLRLKDWAEIGVIE